MPWLRSMAMRAASRSSLVSAMPPSPVVMILTGWKAEYRDVGPAAAPDRFAVPRGADRVRGVFEDLEAVVAGQLPDRVLSVGWPAKCTGTTTFGSRPLRSAWPSFSSSAGTLRFQVSGSMSTKSTSAPQ